nr:MAG TPA: hypothetical protein [Caudoviricetes sp.]
MFGNMPAVHLLSLVFPSDHSRKSLVFQIDNGFNICICTHIPVCCGQL